MTSQQLRDLARRVAILTDDELDQFDEALTFALDDIDRARAQRAAYRDAMVEPFELRPRTPAARLDYILMAAQTGAITAEVAREMIEAAERSDDDPAREWATESTVGTVCSDESLAIARTVTAERSDPYETVVVEADGGGKR